MLSATEYIILRWFSCNFLYTKYLILYFLKTLKNIKGVYMRVKNYSQKEKCIYLKTVKKINITQ